MMFASLSAHYEYGYDLSQKLVKKEYNATKLFRFLKTKNPKFYPNPVEVNDIKDDNGVFQTIPVTEGFLTEEDFCNLYDKACGKLLHAQRTSKFDGNHEELAEDALYYTNRIIKLLNCHWIYLSEDIAFRVLVKGSMVGGVTINVMGIFRKNK